MPIVPTMTAPTVQEQVGNSQVAHSYVPSSQAYEKTFATAMKTLNDGIDTAAKVMEVADARYIKAQSDDAETQIMGAINSALYDKDNGYFTKQGKNAIDAFPDTEKNLKDSIKGITDKLDPRVVNVLQSRIDQRMASANVSMQKWYFSQANQYNVSATESKIDADNKDIANNYANAEFIARTREDAYANIELLGKYKGLGEEVVEQGKKDFLSKSQSSRFQVWAQDDPEGALTTLMNESETMSPEDRRKTREKVERAFAVNCYSRLNGSKILETMNPNTKTGWDVFDKCTANTKLAMIRLAKTQQKVEAQKAVIDLKGRADNALSEVGTYGYSEDVPDIDDFKAAFPNDEKKAQDEFDLFSHRYRVSSIIANSAPLSYEDRKNALEMSKPKQGSETFIEEKKNYLSMKKAFDKLEEDQQKDPVGFAQAHGIYGGQIDFQKPESIVSELSRRINLVDQMSENWKTRKALLSNDEATKMVTTLDNMDIDTRCKTLRGIAKSVGAKGIAILTNQLRGDKKNYPSKYSIAMSAMDMPSGTMTVGEKYLRGIQAVSENRVKVDPASVSGTKAIIAKEIDNLYRNPVANANTKELAFGVWASDCLDNNGGLSANVQNAVKEAVGGEIYRHNGKNIILPTGVAGDSMFGMDIGGKMVAIADKIRDSKENYFDSNGERIFASELAKDLPRCQLDTYKIDSARGVAYYKVIKNGQFVVVQKNKNEDARPLILEVSKEYVQ